MTKQMLLMLVPALMLTAAKDDPLAGRVAGQTVQCISDMDARAQAQILDNRTIAYSRTANRIWITHPEGACPGLHPFRTLVVQRRGAQLCSGDRFRTVRAPASVPSGQCHFGAFTPYDKVAKTH